LAPHNAIHILIKWQPLSPVRTRINPKSSPNPRADELGFHHQPNPRPSQGEGLCSECSRAQRQLWRLFH